jgi:hypothetical protein
VLLTGRYSDKARPQAVMKNADLHSGAISVNSTARQPAAFAGFYSNL